MKIFICGTRRINEYYKDQKLPAEFLSELDDLIKNDEEIIIGDCPGFDTLVQKKINDKQYRNVTVYVSRKRNWTFSNKGKWEEKHFAAPGTIGYRLSVEKDLHMAEDADRGIAIWDEESTNTYVKMVCLAMQKKPCKVFLHKKRKWIVINSLNDLKAYAGPPDEWTDEDKKTALDACGINDEISKYLISKNKVSDYALIDVVCQAPVTLDEKLELLNSLAKKKNLKRKIFEAARQIKEKNGDWTCLMKEIRAIADNSSKESVSSYIGTAFKEIRKARDQIMKNVYDKVFYFFEEWYDTDSFMVKSEGIGLYSNSKTVFDHIKRENHYYDGEGWYRVEAWEPEDTPWKEIRYDYYIFDNKVYWFNKMIPKQWEGGTIYFSSERRFSSGLSDMNFSTPFKTGDIVLIDCRPFGPAFKAMILESRHQYDCCFPNILFRIPYTDKWRLTPLKHKRFFKDNESVNYTPILSPLYRLRRVAPEEMTEDDEKLQFLSDCLNGDEDKAEAVWKMWNKETEEDLDYETVKTFFE